MGAVFHDLSYEQETLKLENRLQARMVNRCVAVGCSNTHGRNSRGVARIEKVRRQRENGARSAKFLYLINYSCWAWQL